MEESITYQEIIKKGEVKGEAKGKAAGKAEGRLEEAREFVVLLGTERFGSPTAAIRRKLSAVADLDQLHQLGRRIVKVASWKELLATK